jgi:hypothetical protein
VNKDTWLFHARGLLLVITLSEAMPCTSWMPMLMFSCKALVEFSPLQMGRHGVPGE